MRAAQHVARLLVEREVAAHHVGRRETRVQPDGFGSIFHAYTALLALRKKIKSFVYGDFAPLVEPGDVLAYRRGAWREHPAVRILLNWSSSPQPWPAGVPRSAAAPPFTNHRDGPSGLLRPWEAVILLDSVSPTS